MVMPPLPWAACPSVNNPFGEEIFLNIQSECVLAQLEAISCFSVTSYLREETNTHLDAASFQVVLESD